jgi:hypothetical protein
MGHGGLPEHGSPWRPPKTSVAPAQATGVFLTFVAVEERQERQVTETGLAATRPSVVTVGVAVFAVYHLALALFMAAAPHAFYLHIGPFGVPNDHYVRDVATYNAALGVGFAIAVRRASWRVPVLAITTVQFALHSVNHLVDIGKAHPAWNGYFDFFSLAAGTLLLAWLLRMALAEARTPHPPPEGAAT